MDRTQNTHGYLWIYQNVCNRRHMLNIAQRFGKVLPHSDGSIVKELRPLEPKDARPNTLSAKHGKAKFPLHSDTAFWPIPARFVALRCVSGSDQPTTCVTINEILTALSPIATQQIKRSLWALHIQRRHVVAKIHFCHGQDMGWRWDENVMLPLNRDAKSARQYLKDIEEYIRPSTIDWAPGICAVIDNWKMLHGRGICGQGSEERILERIYIGN